MTWSLLYSMSKWMWVNSDSFSLSPPSAPLAGSFSTLPMNPQMGSPSMNICRRPVRAAE